MSEPQQTDELKRPLFYLISLFIVATNVLGGANENDWLANVILLYSAAPLLAISTYRLMTTEKIPGQTAKVFIWLSLALLIPLLQLVPLPENIWRTLPFHDLAARLLSTAGVNHPSGPLSLAPDLSWVSFLSLLPPLSIFLTILLFNPSEKRGIIRVILICGVINAIFGLFQLSLNSDTAFYLYPGLSAGDAVGFFKNRNHFAAQMYALLPFAVATVADSLNFKSKTSRRSKIISDYPSLYLGLACIFTFIVSCIFARSRAGVFLLMVALVWMSFIPDWKNLQFRGENSGKSIYSKAYGLIVGFSVIFSLEYGFYRVMTRFEDNNLFGMRQEIALNTLGATIKAFPYGTGLGTFQKIYAAIEPIENVLPHRFVNRAHNDYLELLLETGFAGLLIILGFLFWYVKHLRSAWRESTIVSYDLSMTRASCITIGLLLLHSFVDYPLRTQNLMGLFALCCALLVKSEAELKFTNFNSDQNRISPESGPARVEVRRKRYKTRRS